jgi:hypothetical protein
MSKRGSTMAVTCGTCGKPWLVAWFTGKPSSDEVEAIHEAAREVRREYIVVHDAPSGPGFDPVFTCRACGQPNRSELWDELTP